MLVMKEAMTLLLLVEGLIPALQADETSWNSFKREYNKHYTNYEEQYRQKIFRDSLKKIEEHNKKYEQRLVSYQLGVNAFADLTDEEFAKKFMNLEPHKPLPLGEKDKYDLTNYDSDEHDLTNHNSKEIPESIDWRTKSAVTDVKDQGSCGACWAFAAAGAIEGQVAIKSGQLKSLSTQELIDCHIPEKNGCKGGQVKHAFEYVAQYGITLDNIYPYNGTYQNQTCNDLKTKQAKVGMSGYVIITNNEADLKQAVGLVGPVSVGVNGTVLKHYQNGIFNGSCSDNLTHAVLVVGYEINTTTGEEYWILKNSWGENWGEDGYYKLLMGKNLCGIATRASYPIIKSNSDKFYSYKLSNDEIFLLIVTCFFGILIIYCFFNTLRNVPVYFYFFGFFLIYYYYCNNHLI